MALLLNIDQRMEALRVFKSRFGSQRELSAAIRSNHELKKEIRELYYLLFKRTLTGCAECIVDAFVELVYTNKQAIMEIKEMEFDLKRGTVLYDTVNLDASKMLTRKTLTKELALYHLSTNPGSVAYFSLLPADWEKQVEQYKQTQQGTKAAKTRQPDAEQPKVKKQRPKKTA